MVLACLGASFLAPVDASAATHEVEVGNNFFDPELVQAEVGDTIRWTVTAGFHNVVTYGGTQTFSSPLMGTSSEPYEQTFDGGTVLYRCTPHSSILPSGTCNGMCGAITDKKTPAGTPTITQPADGSSGHASPVTVTGTGEAWTTVRLSEGGSEIAQALVQDAGTWSVEVPLGEGEHTLVADAVSVAGVQSTGTTPVTFTVGASTEITLVEEAVLTGLSRPTATRFAPDGKVFVAEQAGIVKVFDGLTDPTPDVLIDVRVETHFTRDRGLLGLEVHPSWPTVPWVWLLYTKDALPGGTFPQWGSPNPAEQVGYDPCPGPPSNPNNNDPGPDGCVVTGALVRLFVDPSTNTVISRHNLIDGEWCQQFPSHSVASIVYSPDGALYVGAGDGASWAAETDWGQFGGSEEGSHVPQNPCGDPLGGVDPPISQGGSLRSQDIRTAGDPLNLHGSILRLHPQTGAAMPNNPLIGADPADDRYVAYGLRNPYRFTFRPGTDDLYIGDVGWFDWEEIDVHHSPSQAVVNFGWPCYEGAPRTPAWDAHDNLMCEGLYAEDSAQSPAYAYLHGQLPGGCGGGVISGLAFYQGMTYPERHQGSLFFADAYSGCVIAMPFDPGTNHLDPSEAEVVVRNQVVVDIQEGPEGELYLTTLGTTSEFPLEGATGRIIRLRGDICPPNDDHEPNDIPSAARTIGAGASTNAIVCSSDRDWYRIDGVPATHTLYAHVESDQSKGPLALEMRYVDGAPIDAGISADGLAEAIRLRGDARSGATEPILIRVSGSVPDTKIPYELTTIMCQDDPLATQRQSSSTSVKNDALEAVHCPGSADYFRIGVFGGERINVLLQASEIGPSLELVDIDDELLAVGTGSFGVRRLDNYPVRTPRAVYPRIVGPKPPEPQHRIVYAISSEVIDTPTLCQSGLGDAWEPNETPSTAAVPAAFPAFGSICPGEIDWFRVEAEAGERLTTFIASDDAMGDLNMEAYTPAGTTIATSSQLHGGEYLSFTAADEGPYLIRITGELASTMNEYLLHVSSEPATVETSVDGGGTASTEEFGNGGPADAIDTSVTAPLAGTIQIIEEPNHAPIDRAIPLVWQTRLTSPRSSVRRPYTITFDLDRTLAPPGLSPDSLIVMYNGRHLSDCRGAGAYPDPCVTFRGGNALRFTLVVRARDATGTWRFGRQSRLRLPTGPPADQESVTGIPLRLR